MTKQTDSIIKTVPAAAELRKVPGFDPLRYLRRTTSKKSGEPVLKLDLPYKKLWFRLACPNSRTFLKPLRITDQMAIFEAQLFLDRSDQEPIANFTSTMMARDVPGGRYIQAAQDEALNEALDSAGFGIQLADLVEASGGSGYGSEIPLAQVEAAVGGVKQPAPVEREEPLAPAAVPENPPQAAPAPAEQTAEEPAAPVTYTEDMSVEEIRERITVEQAMAVPVDFGTCKGWTLGQVLDRRPSSLRFYVYAAKEASHVLKAAASLLLDGMNQQKAG